MLSSLSIRNYALIENLSLEFGPSLSIITGETGAGKSIMLGALSLVLGGRADTRVASKAGGKTVVEATFSGVDPAMRPLFEERGIDWVESPDGLAEITVRREINASGRSKIFVNDNSVTLQTLSMITPSLVDIHSQHANARINDPAVRLSIIDSIADNEELRREYRELFSEYVSLHRRIVQRRENMERNRQNLDVMRFRLGELDKLNPKKGELAEIERRFELLSDADEFREQLSRLSYLIGDSEGGAQSKVSEAAGLARKYAASLSDSNDSENMPVADRLQQILVELKDISGIAEDAYSAIDTDPATLSKLSDRMNRYYEAMKAFGAKEADELAEMHQRLKREVAELSGEDDLLPQMERESRRLAATLKEHADRLSASRAEAAENFSRLVEETARPLGLPNVSFHAVVGRRKLSASGQDDVEFLCSFNKNGSPAPLQDIASGGEISRMMLSLKSVVASYMNLPTIIFDEIDTGVSGEIADKMGDMMHDMGERMQVVVITHLPQVAAKGEEHFKVFKTDTEDRTVTDVRRLTMEERIREIAGMISGSEVGEAALSAARSLLTPKERD